MSKADTIAALIDGATDIFAEIGYDGASLRDVAARAGAPLSTINMYFGAKADLYIAVMGKIWREVEEDRRRVLCQRTAAKNGVADLRDIFTALIEPLVLRARSPIAADRRVPRLMRHWVGAPLEVREEMWRRSRSAENLKQWIRRVHDICPTLTPSQVTWGFSFAVGSLYSWELMDRRYDQIIDMADIPAQEIVEYLVEFTVRGMEGMIALIEGRGAPALRPAAVVG